MLGPEEAAGSFGGDPDNFNFPRYAFDIALIRLYEDGKPAETPERFGWRSTPLADGELLFISGNPGETGRLWAASTTGFLLDTYFPYVLVTAAELRGRLIMFASRGADEARMAASLLSDIENGYKSDWGERAALASPGFAEALRRCRARIARARCRRRRACRGDRRSLEPRSPRSTMSSAACSCPTACSNRRRAAIPNCSTWRARWSARPRNAPSPRASGCPAIPTADLEQTAEELFEETPVEPAIEEIALAFWLSKAREFLTTDDPLVKLLLGRESPEGLAHRLVSGTRLGDAAERRRLYEGGSAAIAQSDDPMIVFARKFDGQARALGKEFREKVREPKDAALERIARARFRLYGDTVYPDATGTLRLNYGAVAGMDRAGRPQGRALHRLLRAVRSRHRRRSVQARRRCGRQRRASSPRTRSSTSRPATTPIGGNSGSPMIDRDGKFVGALFDGNQHGFGGFYRFDPALNRSVVIAATAIEEGLAKVYGLQRIVDELQGTMTPHLEAAKGDYAETVLLPGDPQRAEWIAANFLSDARCVSNIARRTRLHRQLARPADQRAVDRHGRAVAGDLRARTARRLPRPHADPRRHVRRAVGQGARCAAWSSRRRRAATARSTASFSSRSTTRLAPISRCLAWQRTARRHRA